MKRKKLLIANPTIGADIEVFLRDSYSKDIVSAEGIIKGTKEVPFRFKEGNDYFATSLDNVMAEFCIPPAKDGNIFYNNIKEALDYIEKSIPNDLETFAYPCAVIDEKYLKTENAMLFGCEPDYNVWKYGDMNPKPSPSGNLRSCGGHIHIGYDNANVSTTMELMRAMDIFIGLPSILQEPDNKRKELYGKAGAFRFKDYGGEYRTVSNYYINSPKLIKWVFENTMEAIEFVNEKYPLTQQEADSIQLAINHNNKELAETMCNYFKVKLAA